MRPLVQPPPSTRCACGGELRLKLVEPTDLNLEKVNEIFSCAKCGREISFIMAPDKYDGQTPYMPHRLTA